MKAWEEIRKEEGKEPKEGSVIEHELKTWPEYFDKVASGEKTFELRKNDRAFKVGDVLLLKKWNPKGYSAVSPNELTGAYSGDELRCRIDYVLTVLPHQSGLFGLNSNFCIMSISLLTEEAG